MKKQLLFLPVCLTLSIATFAQVPAYISHLGLCAWFPFTGNANDSSGHGHNGTALSGYTPAKKAGYCLY